MTRSTRQSRTRETGAAYLSGLLEGDPRPDATARMYDGLHAQHAYHLYMFRYDAAAFAGLPRAPRGFAGRP